MSKPGGRGSLGDREGTLAWLFLLPAIAYIVVLVAIPFLLAIAFAFSDVTTGDPSYDWVGFENFSAILQTRSSGARCATRSSSRPSRWCSSSCSARRSR